MIRVLRITEENACIQLNPALFCVWHRLDSQELWCVSEIGGGEGKQRRTELNNVK